MTVKINRPYPDINLIKKLMYKFKRFGVKSMTTDEIIDLINHQNELIHDMKRKLNKEKKYAAVNNTSAFRYYNDRFSNKDQDC